MAYLLSPAGTVNSLIAAVQNGADEVYLGLSDFNARITAENFTVESLEPWVRFAHVRGTKIHVTMNTLLSDSELNKAVALAKDADAIGVDAFIVQDVGLAKKLKQAGIGADLHASTQLAVYNVAGVKMLEELGFSRVVLARELPISEIKEITDSKIMETEAFCHGALCMSYSGECLLSFAQGKGRSGNRGSCSQPCRLKYTRDDGAFGHLLSPSDLCSLSYLNSLVGTGVTSLKIEGRLKSPEYVAAVTSAYRYALDNPGADIKETLDNLQVVFSRGGFCSGHQLGKLPVSAVTKTYAGRTGLFLGKTLSPIRRIPGGNFPTYKVTVSLEKPLAVSDGIVFMNFPDNGGIINKVDSMGSGKYEITVAGKAPDVKPGTTFYKTLDAVLDKKLKLTVTSEKFIKKVPVSCKLVVSKGKTELTFTDKEGRNETSVMALGGDYSGSLDLEKAKDTICATGNTPFEVVSFDYDIADGVFVSYSDLKKLRRDTLEKLAKKREERL